MKLEIEPYDDGGIETGTETETDDHKTNGINGVKGVNGVSGYNAEYHKIASTQKIEVREYVARYNLKGERDLKPVKEEDKKKDDDEDDERGKYCMRSEKWYTREGSLESQSLTIYSAHVHKALREVVREYPGTNLQADPIILNGQLKCVFHYRKELAKYRDGLHDPIAKLHVALLLKCMAKELRHEIRSFEANVESSPQLPTTEFDILWIVFKPGDLVITGKGINQRVLKLQRTYFQCGAECKWYIYARSLDHDGEHYGFVETYFEIAPFTGTRPLSKLDIYPFQYCSDKSDVSARIISRGKRFCSLVGCHYVQYAGLAKALGHQRKVGRWGQLDEYPLETTMVNGRIMVDCKMFAVFKSPNRIDLDERKPINPDLTDQADGFSDDDFLICRDRVLGFSLSTKRWCVFYVDLIQKLELNVKAFDHLLLPEGQKKLVHALVRTHSEDNGGFDDMIKGKGKGLIFVLHGVPGVGKTFTAESVADHLGRPLYVLHSGDLGVTPESVETNLSNALMLATEWKAVLLIDEADVFLEQLFLRILEYYEGILILTTNRVKTFDPAFKSRIHLALKYNALEAPQRKTLWKLFISRAPSAGKDWPDEHLDELAAVDLNGRQIKNAVRTANSLAIAEGETLSQTYLQLVLQTLRTFEADLGNVSLDEA